MKKQLFFLFLGLFLINSVLALDCQYTETENYEIFEEIEDWCGLARCSS